MPSLDRDRQDLMYKAAETPVHHVRGKQHGIEVKPLPARQFQHAEVNGRIFVTGESDIADLPAFRAA